MTAGKLTDTAGNKVRILDFEHAYIGDDKLGTAGTEIFSRRGMERYTKTDQFYKGTDGNLYPVWIYNEEITEAPTADRKMEGDRQLRLYRRHGWSTVRRVTKKESEMTDGEKTIWQIRRITGTRACTRQGQLTINPEILQDSSRIPTKFNENSPQKGGYSNEAILQVVKNFDESLGTLDPNSQTEFDVTHYYAGIIGNLATVSNVWNGIVENQELTVHSCDNERQDVMGVSSDEELSDLIKFQRCYDASSRYITVIDEMLEHLIDRLAQ